MPSSAYTEELGMRRVVAQFTEWAWLEGRIHHVQDLEVLAARFFAQLSGRFPGQAGVRALAIENIYKDMLRSYRALSYGGRTPAQVTPVRRQHLHALFSDS